MLSTTVQLHDIEDVEGFICATIERAGLGGVPEHEKEELVADGFRILVELSQRFEPHRPGYATPGRFSGYAAQFLPRRLGDAWHARHPEHVRVTDSEGKRHWVYRDTPISLDQFLAPGGEHGGRGSIDRPRRQPFAESHIRPHSQTAPVPLPA